MCDPLTIASVALSTAGAAYQGQTQANYVNAVNQANKDAAAISKTARDAEIARQQALENNSTQTFNDTLAQMGADKANAETAQNAQNFTDALANRQTVTAGEQGFLLPGQGDASVAVKDWVARSAHDAAKAATGRIKALANMTGMGSTQGSRIANVAAGQNTLTTNNGLRRGSLAVANQEQNIPAASVTPGSTLLGDLMSGAGMLLGSGIFTNPFAPLNAAGLPTSVARAGTAFTPSATSAWNLPAIY